MHILAVDDEEVVLSYVTDLLKMLGHEVENSPNAIAALEKMKTVKFDLVISDIFMPEMNGIQFLEQIGRSPEPTPVLLLTGFADIQTAVQALQKGAYDYMLKPIEAHDLKNRLEHFQNEQRLLRRAEEERQRSILMSRMAAVGQLAAGVAHEINNPMTFLRGNAQIMKALLARVEKAESAGDAEQLRKQLRMMLSQVPDLLQGIERGTERIRKITFGLSAFANGQLCEQRAKGFLNACVRDSLLLVGEKPEDLALLLELEDDLPAIPICRRAMTQALACVIKNAVQAAAAAKSKTVRVSTFSCDGGVAVTVEDSGLGVSEEIRDRIYEPFFTTRGVNEGAGLGLSVAYGIVCSDHSGKMSYADSDLGGACFRITLPGVVAAEEPEEAQLAALA